MNCVAGHMGPALHCFLGQGPCALPGVQEKNPPVTASPCQPPLGKGAIRTGVRIATTSLRTGLAMTGVLHGVWCAAGHMGPALHFFVGQGPCALPGVRETNPPVTASPCQPPLGKGAIRTGVRIATTSLRTGLAMTWFLHGVQGVIQMVFSK